MFEFAKSAVADASGTATLILPYSLWEGPAAAGLASPYRVASGSGSTELWLTEEDVLQGRTIELSLPNRTW